MKRNLSSGSTTTCLPIFFVIHLFCRKFVLFSLLRMAASLFFLAQHKVHAYIVISHNLQCSGGFFGFVTFSRAFSLIGNENKTIFNINARLCIFALVAMRTRRVDSARLRDSSRTAQHERRQRQRRRHCRLCVLSTLGGKQIVEEEESFKAS